MDGRQAVGLLTPGDRARNLSIAMETAHARTVGYEIIESTLGRMLIGASPKGLCSVMWGGNDRELADALQQLFPRDLLCCGLERPSRWSGPLKRYLGGEPVDLDFPLDLRATPFQRSVWHRIREIPIGATLSYGGLAKALGNPGATRAVAGACASNPVAMVIPCHRVIRGDGGLGGYRWGLPRKQRLLSLEARMANPEDRSRPACCPSAPARSGSTRHAGASRRPVTGRTTPFPQPNGIPNI